MINLKFIKEIDEFFLDNEDNASILVSVIKREINIDVVSFYLFLTCSTLELQQEDCEKRKKYVKQYHHNKKKYDGLFSPLALNHKFLYKYNKNDSTQMIWTTQAQLLFFKWAIESKLFGLVSKYALAINKNGYNNVKEFDEINDMFDKYSNEPCVDDIVQRTWYPDLSSMTDCAMDDPSVSFTLYM